MYNGLNVQQTKRFIKISCTTYIEKILKGKDWSNEGNHTITKTPMNHDKKILIVGDKTCPGAECTKIKSSTTNTEDVQTDENNTTASTTAGTAQT